MALHEAERRVRSIALVHEILSRDPSDQVPFAEIVSSLVQMAEDSVVSSQPIVIAVHGDLGEVAADVATPLAVTVAELLQNAVEHAFDARETGGQDGGPGWTGAAERRGAGTRRSGHVDVHLSNDAAALRVEVRRRRARVCPEGFDIERHRASGSRSSATWCVSQLEGTISMEPQCRRPTGAGPRGHRASGAGGEVPRSRRSSAAARDRRCGRAGGPDGRVRRSGAAAAGGQPGLAQLAALFFGGAAPDAGLLVGGQGEVEAGLVGVAGAADPLGRLDLVDGGPGRADGEEEVRFGVAAGGRAPPVVRRPSRPSGST